MADPRAFVSFDYDHNEESRRLFRWARKKRLADPVHDRRLVLEGHAPAENLGADNRNEDRSMQPVDSSRRTPNPLSDRR